MTGNQGKRLLFLELAILMQILLNQTYSSVTLEHAVFERLNDIMLIVIIIIIHLLKLSDYITPII